VKKAIPWFLAVVGLSMVSLAAQAPATMLQWQKAAGGKLEFEVASVRPSKAQDADLSNSNLDLDLSDYFRYAGGPIRTTRQPAQLHCLRL
jgi:hypothetical protein